MVDPPVPRAVSRRGLLTGGLALLAAGTGCRHAVDPQSPWLYPRSVSPAVAASRPNPSDGPTLSDERIPWTATPLLWALRDVVVRLRTTRYSHVPYIDPARGIYRFDCSVMVAWLLSSAAPYAHQSLTTGLADRPRAVDFYRRIAASPPQLGAGGWLRVPTLFDALPGDVVAWPKPAGVRSRSTGHVAVIVLPPVRVDGFVDAFLVRVADASTTLHDRDTREGRDGQGFGIGTMLFVIDPAGAPIGFGWRGTRSPRIYATDVEIGRALG